MIKSLWDMYMEVLQTAAAGDTIIQGISRKRDGAYALDFKQELIKLATLAQQEAAEPPNPFANIDATLARIARGQTELLLQVEGMQSQLEERSADTRDEERRETRLIGALIAMLDGVEDFCRFAEQDAELRAQARMMLSAMLNRAAQCGLARVACDGALFDAACHTVASVASDARCANGCVLYEVRGGYLYDGTIVRKAAVVVNKVEERQIKEPIEELKIEETIADQDTEGLVE